MPALVLSGGEGFWVSGDLGEDRGGLDWSGGGLVRNGPVEESPHVKFGVSWACGLASNLVC